MDYDIKEIDGAVIERLKNGVADFMLNREKAFALPCKRVVARPNIAPGIICSIPKYPVVKSIRGRGIICIS